MRKSKVLIFSGVLALLVLLVGCGDQMLKDEANDGQTDSAAVSGTLYEDPGLVSAAVTPGKVSSAAQGSKLLFTKADMEWIKAVGKRVALYLLNEDGEPGDLVAGPVSTDNNGDFLFGQVPAGLSNLLLSCLDCKSKTQALLPLVGKGLNHLDRVARNRTGVAQMFRETVRRHKRDGKPVDPSDIDFTEMSLFLGDEVTDNVQPYDPDDPTMNGVVEGLVLQQKFMEDELNGLKDRLGNIEKLIGGIEGQPNPSNGGGFDPRSFLSDLKKENYDMLCKMGCGAPGRVDIDINIVNVNMANVAVRHGLPEDDVRRILEEAQEKLRRALERVLGDDSDPAGGKLVRKMKLREALERGREVVGRFLVVVGRIEKLACRHGNGPDTLREKLAALLEEFKAQVEEVEDPAKALEELKAKLAEIRAEILEPYGIDPDRLKTFIERLRGAEDGLLALADNPDAEDLDIDAAEAAFEEAAAENDADLQDLVEKTAPDDIKNELRCLRRLVAIVQELVRITACRVILPPTVLPPETPSSEDIGYIEVIPGYDELQVGQVRQFIAMAVLNNGDTVPLREGVRWEVVSENPLLDAVPLDEAAGEPGNDVAFSGEADGSSSDVGGYANTDCIHILAGDDPEGGAAFWREGFGAPSDADPDTDDSMSDDMMMIWRDCISLPEPQPPVGVIDSSGLFRATRPGSGAVTAQVVTPGGEVIVGAAGVDVLERDVIVAIEIFPRPDSATDAVEVEVGRIQPFRVVGYTAQGDTLDLPPDRVQWNVRENFDIQPLDPIVASTAGSDTVGSFAVGAVSEPTTTTTATTEDEEICNNTDPNGDAALTDLCVPWLPLGEIGPEGRYFALREGEGRVVALYFRANGGVIRDEVPVRNVERPADGVDLLVGSFLNRPLVPVAGQDVHVAVRVRNLGAEDVDGVSLVVYDISRASQWERRVIGRAEDLEVPAGGTAKANFVWDTTHNAGIHLLTVVVDESDEIEETNEENNTRIFERLVRPRFPGDDCQCVTEPCDDCPPPEPCDASAGVADPNCPPPPPDCNEIDPNTGAVDPSGPPPPPEPCDDSTSADGGNCEPESCWCPYPCEDGTACIDMATPGILVPDENGELSCECEMPTNVMGFSNE